MTSVQPEGVPARNLGAVSTTPGDASGRATGALMTGLTSQEGCRQTPQGESNDCQGRPISDPATRGRGGSHGTPRPSARAEQILEEEAEWRAARDEERATLQTARTIGMMTMIDCGWQVYSRTEGSPDEFVMDADGEAVGGIVLAVGDKVTEYDIETGEVTRLRSFATIDPSTLRYHNLTEKQIDPERVMPPDAALTHRVISRLAEKLVARNRKVKSLLADEEKRLTYCASIHQLAASLRRGLGA